MVWIAIVIGLVAAGAGLWYYANSGTRRPDPSIEPEKLATALRETGLDLDTSHTPDSSIVAPHVPPGATCIDAIRGKSGGKRVLLALFDDRLVAGLATAGDIGAEVDVWDLSAIEGIDSGFDVGGTLSLNVGGETFEVTHVPRDQLDGFERQLRERTEASTGD
ncbi:MAG: hypothetical protein ABEL76_01330 [Bradymonadaceae bacterium]